MNYRHTDKPYTNISGTSIWILILSLFTAPSFASEGDTWKVFINNGNVLEFEIQTIADNGIVGLDGRGISYNVMDSIVVHNQVHVDQLSKFFSPLSATVRYDGTYVNVISSTRIPIEKKTEETFIVRTRTQLFAGERLGILLDYKKSTRSHFLIRIDGSFIKGIDYDLPLYIGYGLGPGWDYWFEYVGVSVAAGYLLEPRMYEKGVRQFGFIHPLLNVRLGSEGKYSLSMGVKLRSRKLPKSFETVHSEMTWGIGCQL